MSTDKRQFTLRLQNENFEKIRVIASRSKRSTAMQIEYLIENCINEYEKQNGTITFDDSPPTPTNQIVQNNHGKTNLLATGSNNNFFAFG